MKFNIIFKQAAKLLCLLAVIMPVQAYAESEIYTSFFSNDAVSGYDSVAFFSESKPVKGNSRYMMSYKGAKWYFSSQENLDKFKADPVKYAPQYGGYCAWAVAQNDTQKGDPNHWSIHDGKLYLNYDAEIKDRWLADRDAFISKADKYWPEILE